MHNRYISKLILFFPIAAIFFISGCSNTESANINTAGMKAEITATANGSGSTEINVDLSVGSGGIFATGVELSSGDTLTATDGSTTRTLVKDSSLIGDVEYETTFSTEAEDTQFTVSLIRNSDDNAESSVVTLPAPYTLTAPTSVSGNGNTTVALSWTPFGESDPMTLEVDCKCTKTNGGDTYLINSLTVTDDGSENYSVRALIDEDDPTVYDLGCDIDITMKRTRTGTLDAGYGEGGYIRAVQAREKRITYTP